MCIHTHKPTLLHSSKCLMKIFNFQIRANYRDRFLRLEGKEDYPQIWLQNSICITELQSIICHFKSLSTVYLLLLLTWFVKPSYSDVMNACSTGYKIRKKFQYAPVPWPSFSQGERMPNTFMDYFSSLDFHCQNSQQLLIISSNHIALMWARHCSKLWTSINLFDLHRSPLNYLIEAKWYSR